MSDPQSIGTTTEIPIEEKKLFKLTNSTSIHNGYEYKEGLNVDTLPWNYNQCSNGGFYVTEKEHIPLWLSYRNEVGLMEFIWDAAIPKDSKWNARSPKN